MKKIAIMTAGGDCPGLNSVIRTVVMSSSRKGLEVVGIKDGYIGFVEGKYETLDVNKVHGIENEGGTILGSSNKECPFAYPSEENKEILKDRVEEVINKLKAQGVEDIIIIGGDGTLDSARVISERGMNVIGIPKTIDNDMSASSPTIGFQTAVETATYAIRKLKSTAYSHRRVMVVELMGRTSGYLTLNAGFSSGADIILLPENDYDFNKVKEHVTYMMNTGQRYAIIAMSEASKEKGEEETISHIVKDSFEKKRYGGVSKILADKLEKETGFETRNLILGHLQRGGEPCADDIILAAKLGEYALQLLLKGEQGYIVGVKDLELTKTKFPKERIARLLDYNNNDLIKTAKNMGICFGD